MGASISSGDDFVSEINVTPFVDVMLVLLIIFMVTAPMMTEGLEVELPEVKTAEVLPTEQDHVMLTLKADNQIFVADKPVTLEELPMVLETLVTAEKKQLFLHADKSISYGVVMEVMSAVRAAGIANVGMVALSSDPASAGEDKGTVEEKPAEAEKPTHWVHPPIHRPATSAPSS